MGSMEAVLKEELGRLGDLERGYREAIRKLPKGSIQQKRINKIAYPYLVQRKGSKVVSRYVGNQSESELSKLKEGIELRRKYQKLFKEARKNQIKIHRMLYGKKRAI